jgi:RNA polymerase sigma-70 factor (ECF subfamily)
VAEASGGEGLEAALRAAAESARAALPSVTVDPAAFIEHVRSHLPEAGGEAALASLHVADLYLACACARGDKAALDDLDRRFLSQVHVHLARFGRSPDFADEVQQELRQALLVAGETRRARILEYSGHGPLLRWIRVAAVRTAISLQRTEKPTRPDDMLEMLLPGPDPELDFIKLRDRGAVRTAILDAIKTLESRDLGLLRLHYVELVSLDKLAAVHRVHRATMARWLASARDQILRRSRALLRERLKLSTSECDSLIQLVRSRLEASLARALSSSSGDKKKVES